MPIVTLPIANGSYLSDSLPLSAQECVNWYPNIVQAPALNTETLIGTPGTTQLATTGTVQQVNRGGHVLAGVPYFVNGTTLYRLNESGATYSTTSLGTIESTGRVSMADNGAQLLILVPGGKGYVFTTDPDTLTEITDADFDASGDPQHVVFIDGYFVFTTDSNKFIISALNDGLAYNALDFGSAESSPDDVVAPYVFKNQLFIGGSQTTEAFQNIGGADFPFQRTGLFLEKGIAAPHSVVNASDSVLFIGSGINESPAIWAMQGNSVQKVSTTAIDSLLQGFTDTEINDSFSWSYAQKGAYFVGFALPTTTLVIDTVSGRWHERKSEITDALAVQRTKRSRINSLVSAYGKVIVGDSVDGRIGSLEPETFSEYGIEIIRTIATQPFQNNMQSFVVPYLELTMESGAGNDAVIDPQIGMARSTNGGKTFSDFRLRAIGKKGEYNRRTIWRRIGRASRFELFRFTLSDAVNPSVLQLTAKIEAGQ